MKLLPFDKKREIQNMTKHGIAKHDYDIVVTRKKLHIMILPDILKHIIA